MKRSKKILRLFTQIAPIVLLLCQVGSSEIVMLGIPIPMPPDVNYPTQPRPGRYIEHLDQMKFLKMIKGREAFNAFELAQDKGDDFFDNAFMADTVFGAGANVGHGQRFTRVPRADLIGPKDWANHTPARATGPNAASCIECHTMVRHDGGGAAGLNAIRDPLHSGVPAKFINRNTPHLFGQGALQLLAEEMTAELHAILDCAKTEACEGSDFDDQHCDNQGPVKGAPPKPRPLVRRRLVAKGTDFGEIRVRKDCYGCRVDFSHVQGIDADLVVKPFQWKGSVAFIRDFNRGASHNENGIQAVEVVGDDVDGDGDGTINEASVGDITALTVYIASQPRPTTKEELAWIGQIPRLSPKEQASILRGKQIFKDVGCASCHTPMMKLVDPVYNEPSKNPYFRDKIFPAGQDPVSRGLDPRYPIRFDLTREVVGDFGTFNKDSTGMTIVELYSDLKRHNLGLEDAESIDEAGTGKSTWLTKALWGVGSTPPYMHDGRASTILQAIDSHGGEAAASRNFFRLLPKEDQDDLTTFLMNLMVFKFVETDS